MAENAKAGTTDWRLGGHWKPGSIEGFADATSVETGSTFGLHVSTPDPTFHVEAYRMGYYGGRRARLVWRSPEVDGHLGDKPRFDPTKRTVSAPWPESMRVKADAAWPPGYYLLKLVSSGGAQHYVNLVVRDDNNHAAYVVMASVTTWQAYNLWGGYDLYEGTQGSRSTFANRSRVVSFDRPYKIGDGGGDLGNELPLVAHVESLGLDVTYWTDIDLHERPQLLVGHRALLSLGHDEYWSLSMRDGATAARDRGVNLAFLGANAAFRHIRLAPSPLGPDRLEIDYKSAKEDPLAASDPADATVDWREPPTKRPESQLIGDLYECNPVKADLVVVEPSNWILAGTNLGDGATLADVVGPEYDRAAPGPGWPRNVEIVAHSPVRCHGRPSYADTTYYSAPSGAGVFATGTNRWIDSLDRPCSAPPCVATAVVTMTDNVLAAFGSGPAGAIHPSTSNYLALPHGNPPPPAHSDKPTSTTLRRPKA